MINYFQVVKKPTRLVSDINCYRNSRGHCADVAKLSLFVSVHVFVSFFVVENSTKC